MPGAQHPHHKKAWSCGWNALSVLLEHIFYFNLILKESSFSALGMLLDVNKSTVNNSRSTFYDADAKMDPWVSQHSKCVVIQYLKHKAHSWLLFEDTMLVKDLHLNSSPTSLYYEIG